MIAKVLLIFLGILGGNLSANKVDVKFLIPNIEKQKALPFALVINIPKHSHIYTETDKCSPTKIEFTLPGNCSIQKIEWPQPKSVSIGNTQFLAYEGKIYIYGKIDGAESKDLENIRANLTYIVCGKLCTPEEAKVKPEIITREVWETLPKPKSKESFSSRKILIMIVFAFLGGIILNLMPCVLPILSLKVLQISEMKSAKHLKRSGLFFTLGSVCSFWGLAFILHLIKQAGMQVGWGFQLQSPSFVIGLIFLFFTFAMNLFGLFEIGASFSKISQKAENSFNPLASFLSGVLACIVATPCSAPFMGVAVGYALTQNMLHGLVVFTSLAFGVSAPYLGVCYTPKVTKFFPKPGPWIRNLKIILGFGMLASVVWLLHIIAAQIDIDQLLNVLIALFIISFSVWIYGEYGHFNRKKRVKIPTILVVIFIIGIALANAFKNQHTDQDMDWVPFSTKIVESNIKKKRAVFIDFTAKWCITCQLNKKLVLNTPKVKELFAKHNVVLVRADWTNYDAKIKKELEKYERSSVPFYILITTDGKHEILPEILTTEAIQNALRKIN